MNFGKKFDRAFQWAGEKMGSEAKTTMSDDFKSLEAEMALRHDGMERLQRSMTAYVKWEGRRNEIFEDREKGLPVSYLGRTMVGHGEDFEPDSEFGNCLVVLGRAEERLASSQERYVADATAAWLESLDRSLAMMKEYQAARKKLENRRLAYDASITKMQKAKRDDFRVEEELRTSRAKYEESSEDVLRRMQDIKDAEAESIRDLTAFLDCQLDYHERCADELRRAKRSWPGAATAAAAGSSGNSGYGARARANTARSYHEPLPRSVSYTSTHSAGTDAGAPDDAPAEPLPPRIPIRSNNPRAVSASPEKLRPPMGRASTCQNDRLRTPSSAGASGAVSPVAAQAAASVSSLRSTLRPVAPRLQTASSNGYDDEDTASGVSGNSPDWAENRSASPATSYGSLSRSTSNVAVNTAASNNTTARKPPPPPPVRAKKPPPPIPAKREVGY